MPVGGAEGEDVWEGPALIGGGYGLNTLYLLAARESSGRDHRAGSGSTGNRTLNLPREEEDSKSCMDEPWISTHQMKQVTKGQTLCDLIYTRYIK